MINIEECEKTDDGDLVKLSLKNQDYFYCLISRYQKKLLRYIRRISSFSKEDAEDVLQEVFISVYKNLNEFDNDLKFSSWIYRIAHNKTVSQWRKLSARPKTVSGDDEDNNLFEFIAGDDDIAKKLEKKCSSKRIRKIIFSLEEKYRDVLVLKFLEDKDYREISDILKKPMGTVATLISRAKKRFIEETKRQNIDI
ncbi:MAG: RNA polymerase sigma factor [Candidatus Moranbacteria bacterium]|nr:RNA polymerase sigma factor [Candidatus Moranbacteria bacterium]